MIYIVSNIPLIEDSRFKEASIQDVAKFMESRKTVAVDTETEGFFDFDNDVIMLQVGDCVDQYVIDTRGLDISLLKPYFESNTITKVFWNAKFDINFLRHSFGFRVNNVYDCFLAESLLNAGYKDAKLSLGAGAIKYCNKVLNKEVRNKFTNLEGIPFNSSQIVYGAEDVEYLLKIKEIQERLIEEQDLERVLYLENNAVLAIADIEYNGICIDTQRWIEVAVKTEALTDEYIGKLDSIVLNDARLSRFVPPGIQGNLFGYEERRLHINWGAPKQKLKILHTIGVDVDSTDISELIPYRHFPLVGMLIEYSKYKKLSESFGRDFLKFVNPLTNRIHQSIWQILSTGRMSSREPLVGLHKLGELREH